MVLVDADGKKKERKAKMWQLGDGKRMFKFLDFAYLQSKRTFYEDLLGYHIACSELDYAVGKKNVSGHYSHASKATSVAE